MITMLSNTFLYITVKHQVQDECFKEERKKKSTEIERMNSGHFLWRDIWDPV